MHSFKESPYIIQSFITDCPSAYHTSDSYIDSDEIFMCEFQGEAAASSHKRSLYADLHVSTSAYSKPLHLRCKLDTAADVNVMPVIAYKNCFMTTALVSWDQCKPT